MTNQFPTAPEGANQGSASVKVAVESATRCGGNCSGCMLTLDERRAAGVWDARVREAAGRLADARIGEALSRYGEGGIGTVGLLCGQGDHFLMPDEAVAPYVAWLARSRRGLAVATVSSSLVGKGEAVRRKADLFHEASVAEGVPLVIGMVFDPEKMMRGNFKPEYAESMAHVRQQFGIFDIAVNLGPDVLDAMPAPEMDAFARRNSLIHVEFALLPTLASANAFAPRWKEIVRWTRDLHALQVADPAYDLVYGYMLSIHIADTAGLDAAGLVAHLTEQFRRGLYVENHGDVTLMQSGGLGNVVPHARRFGYQPVGHVLRDSPEAVLQKAEAAAGRAARALVRDSLTDPRCAACPFMGACAASGLGVVRKVMAPKGVGDASCPIGIRGLLEDVAQANAARGRVSSRFTREVVQEGFRDRAFVEARAHDWAETHREIVL